MSLYDMLCEMNEGGVCVLDDLKQDPSYCCSKSTAEVDNCEECIQRWLNEEHQEKNVFE